MKNSIKPVAIERSVMTAPATNIDVPPPGAACVTLREDSCPVRSAAACVAVSSAGFSVGELIACVGAEVGVITVGVSVGVGAAVVGVEDAELVGEISVVGDTEGEIDGSMN